MNLIVYFSMSWVKLGDLLDGYLGNIDNNNNNKIYINKNKKPFLKLSLSNWTSCLIKH
jgi:hypothetical protein